MNNVKVIISDLDGTLLNNDHSISPFTKAVFQELYKKKYLIIVATGRHHLDAMTIVEDLGFPIYLVTSNGARIHSPTKEVVFSYDIESEVLKSVLALDIDPEITTVLFKENFWQTNKSNEKLNSFHTNRKYLPEVVDFENLEDFSAIKLFFTHDDHQKLVNLKDRILIDHSELLSHAFSLPMCLEFMDKSVDKSFAIAKILELENFTFNQTISFGDGFNDEKMLKSSGKGLIMGNAPIELKNKLSFLEVITSNNENGVAEYLVDKILNNDAFPFI